MRSGVFQSLHSRIREGLGALGIEEPTPPQEKVIPLIMAGENVLLVAPTASGKTEAAILPVFNYFLSGSRRRGYPSSTSPPSGLSTGTSTSG
jgi:ATP-dependent Lhr-like helicase